MKRTFTTKAALTSFAAEFARRLEAGDVVAFSGPLGAGKTTFIRSIVQERLRDDPTTSPTFTFRHRYEPRAASHAPAIEHLDLFRIESAAETRELGLEEAFDGRSIVLVEWWEKAPQLLPMRRYEIVLDGVGNGPRTLTVHEPK
ncbi:MAG: tRNA (adenosine(37)-N6)-threonylcarbamoyltransferase complex ATPase subunit type 1 TsaE [Candidatus Eremiobacteraeota bacterium]|nr:tRNA (adenosine(37)-N6)-threonylcarbamoyltransferase complex ATPase subunit type 1 TsaE [Candidatus Eremiobacteraeota bacterium]